MDKRGVDRARAVGGSAVIDIKHWRQLSGFSWIAPHGSGEMVKLRDSSALANAASPSQGSWF